MPPTLKLEGNDELLSSSCVRESSCLLPSSITPITLSVSDVRRRSGDLLTLTSTLLCAMTPVVDEVFMMIVECCLKGLMLKIV